MMIFNSVVMDIKIHWVDLCNLPICTIIKKYIFTLSRLILIIENIFWLKKLTIYSDCHNDPTLQYFTCLHIVTLIQVCLYTNRKKKKKIDSNMLQPNCPSDLLAWMRFRTDRNGRKISYRYVNQNNIDWNWKII